MKPLPPNEDFHDEVIDLISQIPHGVLIIDKEGYGIWCNQKWFDYTGWAKEELIGRPVIDLLFKENRHLINQFNQILNQIFSKNYSTPITATLTNCLTGTISIFQLSGSLYREKYGMLLAVDLSGQSRDPGNALEDQAPPLPIAERTATDWKESHVELTKSRKVATTGGWEYDFGLGQISFTQEIYEILEIGKRELDLKDFYNFFLGDHRDSIRHCINELLTYGKAYDIELKLKTGRGKIKWIRSIGQAEWKDHEISHAYGVIQDISERKEKEEVHQASERLFNKAFELAPIGIGLVSPEGNWLKINVAMIGFFEYPEKELITIPLGELWPTEDLQKIFAHTETVELNANEAYVFEGEYVRRENKIKWGRVNINAVKGEHDQPTYYIVQIVDITSKKKFEESLIVAKKEAEEANNAKSRFLSTISHEIRTPL